MQCRLLQLSPVVLIVWILLSWLFSSPAAAQPQLFTDDVFTPLSLGYEALRSGNNEAARMQFEKAIKIDRYNPYALNNLAVLMEREGKLKEAMAYLLEAETYAAEYLNKPDEICDVGGLCLAVNPAGKKSQKSSIAPLIHGNINLLRIKIGKDKSGG